MRPKDRLASCPAISVERGPDTREGGQWPLVIQRKPDGVLSLRLGVRLRCVFGKAVERDQASVFWFQPSAPVRRTGIPHVGNWRPANPRRRRHAPAHHRQFGAGIRVADHRSAVVREYSRHWGKVADVAMAHAEQPGNRFLVRRDRIKVAHRQPSQHTGRGKVDNHCGRSAISSLRSCGYLGTS